ncbi:membrane protein [Pontibacillus halophilus JSM 076056 = DSM 19796]|uniref:Membrane protein n=1 Tax=Pontibacillus halophilus JSM 076056 = DSM 19796 TaxID=1385510 RepID=A0A0A5GP39_9BACI|nr:YitT family protein [Pontibacillus halophilus]KGX92940.1 membrane protein [Pontibacillus halophilus JSM 076056 = DSM 19796]
MGRTSAYATQGIGRELADYGLVLIGSAFVATAFNIFLLPNEIASGGVSGISTITKSLFDWNPAFVQGALNIPLFLIGIFFLGKSFGLKSLVGTIALPLFVYLTQTIEPATENALLAAIFGGMGVGLGLGIVFKGRASTGGVDVAAQVIHRTTHLSLGLCIAMIDGLIVTTAALAIDLEKGLLALVALFVTSRTIDFVQVGFNRSKNVMIISKEMESVRLAVLQEIDRGVTVLRAVGGYTNEERPIIMCVVEQSEFTKLTQTVKQIDPSAFVIAMDAAEVLGEGFKTN